MAYLKFEVFVTQRNLSIYHEIIHENDEILLLICNVSLVTTIHYLSISTANFKFNQITLWHLDSWDSCNENEET